VMSSTSCMVCGVTCERSTMTAGPWHELLPVPRTSELTSQTIQFQHQRSPEVCQAIPSMYRFQCRAVCPCPTSCGTGESRVADVR
jgi:hypothetical protein